MQSIVIRRCSFSLISRRGFHVLDACCRCLLPGGFCATYRFGREAMLKVYVQQSNSLRYVDLCCFCPSTIIRSSNRPSGIDGTNRDLSSQQFGVVVRTRVRSTNALHQISSFDWQALSDLERRLLQKELRKLSAYKTALCREFRDTGRCAYGSACRFAHGEHELRLAPQAHPKYKTQLCINFSRDGRCRYGARCQFVHLPSDEGEPRQPKIAPATQLRGTTVRTVAAAHFPYQANGQASSFNGTGGVISNEPHREQCRDQMKVRCSELPLDLQTGEGQRILNSISLAEQRGKRKVENALSKKSVEVQASVNPSHLPQVRTGGSVSPVGVLTDMLNNWIFDEEHNAFSQSCFARINSPS